METSDTRETSRETHGRRSGTARGAGHFLSLSFMRSPSVPMRGEAARVLLW